MSTLSVPVLLRVLSMLVVILATLVGCGGSDYVSTDEFLETLTIDDDGEGAVGTLPSIDQSMEKVARIRLETDTFDMGVVPHDSLAHGKLNVYNDGEMPLKITKIDTTCACTQGAVTPENAVVDPGEEAWIDVVIDPRRISGFHSEKTLMITSTDPKNRSLQVKVIANVDPEYEIGSEDIDLGQIAKGESLEKRIRFRQLIERPVKVTGLEAIWPKDATPDLTTAVEEVPESEWTTPGRQEYNLVFNFGATMPAGPFLRYVNLITDIQRVNRHRLTFSGMVVAPYTVTPQNPGRVELKKKNGDTTFYGEFSVSAGVPITFGDIVADDAALSAEVKPGDAPNTYTIAVTYLGEGPKFIVFNDILNVSMTVNGTTYSERVGVYISPPFSPVAAPSPGQAAP